MQTMIECSGLSVATELFELIERDIVPGTGVDPKDFWQGFASIVADLAPKNRELLQKRADIQHQINEWHHQHPEPIDFAAYQRFLSDIGYLVPEGEDFLISTENVDPEIASVAGPQRGPSRVARTPLL